MSIRTAMQSWGNKIGEFYVNSLYEQKRLPFFWIIEKLLSRVSIDDGSLKVLEELSAKGVVIYALKNKSQLNCLIIRNLAATKGVVRPAYCHGINMLLWQPFARAFRALLARFFHNPFKKEYLKRTTIEQSSSIIYLRGSEFVSSIHKKDPLLQLIDAAREMEVPLYLVPILVAYSKHREKKNKTIGDLLFGQSENPGMLKRLLTFLRHSKNAFVLSSDPIHLQEFVEDHQNNSSATMAYLLRRRLIDRIDGEKRAVVGPVMKSREEIISMALRDPDLVVFMEETASSGKKSYQEIINEAQKDLFEIAANYNETYINLFDRALTWLWNNIYDGVVIDKEGLARLRKVSREMPFVVVPCHRSHIDYLLLSYVFYHNNIQQPFIAAGNNLLFWPMGNIFRNSGAFFLRRSFRNDHLYAQVFSAYIKVILKEGFPIEFFIEGGRSRTGKMVMPKYGLLSIIIQAFREGACKDLAIVPVYIGYDRVIEERSYLKELGGGEKEPEKASSLLKSRKVLKKRYGSVYLNIGEPIQMDSYLSSQDIPIEDMTVPERQSLYRKVGYEIAHKINDISVVTPYSLIAAGILCHFKRGIANDDLMNFVGEFMHYLTHRGIRFSSTLAQSDKSLYDALNQFEASGLISKMGPEEDEEEEFLEVIYSVDEEKRLNLEYYKNNILHFFLPISFVATSILSSDNDEVSIYKIIDDYGFFKRLFRHEFIFDDDIDDASEVNDVLAYMRERDLISGHDNGERAWIEVRGKGRRNLRPFVGLINNYIESYWITIRGCAYIKSKARSEKDLVKRVHKLGIKMYKKGEISKTEALSQSNYKNALRFLGDVNIIEKSRQKDEKSRPLFTLTAHKVTFETLRRKLFNFMT